MRKWYSDWTKRTCGSENLPQLCSFPSLIKFLTCKCSTVEPDILHLARELCSSVDNGQWETKFCNICDYTCTETGFSCLATSFVLNLFSFVFNNLPVLLEQTHMHCKCCITHDSLAHTVVALVCPIPIVSLIQCLSPPTWQTPKFQYQLIPETTQGAFT